MSNTATIRKTGIVALFFVMLFSLLTSTANAQYNNSYSTATYNSNNYNQPHYNTRTFSYLPPVVQNNWAVQEHYFGNDTGYGSRNWTDVQIPSPQIYSQNISQNESDNERYARYRAEDNHYKNFFFAVGGYTPPQQNMNSTYNQLYNHYYYDTRDNYQR